MERMNKCYTITYGDVAENHARMQQIGTLHEAGYSFAIMKKVYRRLRREGVDVEMYNLNEFYTGTSKVPVQEAYLLVIRQGAQHILGKIGKNTKDLMAENDALTMDTKALMRGNVVNKKARWNLCFADEDQEPDYKDGKGRIVAWRHIPLMQTIREQIADWTGDELLNGEANYYYDITKCGIGYHGDGERRKVFAVRMGADMPLYYQWFQRHVPVGPRMQFDLHDGDMYMMSEKAVGFDWKQSVMPTLRHATGTDEYTVYKEKKQKP